MTSPIVKRFQCNTRNEVNYVLTDLTPLTFLPGEITNVTSEQWEQLKENKVFNMAVDSGDFTEIKLNIPPESLPSMSPDSSRQAILDCSDVATLEAFARAASSPYLQEQIKARVEELLIRLDQIPSSFPIFDTSKIDIGTLTSEEARSVIAATSDMKNLVDWRAKATPKVKGLINQRIKELDARHKETEE